MKKGSESVEKSKLTFSELIKVLGVVIVFIGFSVLLHTGTSTVSKTLHQAVTKAGVWGPLLFIVFQILQVCVPILPGGVSLSLGVLIFGDVQGFLYNYIGIVLGSICAFLLVRRYGKKLILLLVSEKTFGKYMDKLKSQKNFNRFFLLAILSPVAPDDLLCMLAGLTKMPFKTFCLIIFFCKPFAIFAYGSGLTAILKHFFN